MKTALKWGSNLVTIILAIFLVVTMYYAVSSKVKGGPPEIFGHRMYVVLSGSMEPVIRTGSIVVDDPNVDTKTLKVGDVVTFKASDDPNMLITHRIMAIETQDGQLAFQTKGDANDAPDTSLVPAQNIVAKYDNLTIPYLGFIMEFLKSKKGIALLLILPGTLLILSTVISLYREVNKLQKNSQNEAG